MNDQMFTVIQGRFDKLESLLEDHVKADNEAHKIVDRHETYVNIIKWIGPGGLIAGIASYFGMNHFKG